MIEKIKRLWDEGLSMGRIAAELGLNTNKIAGHIYRARKSGIVFDERVIPRSLLKNPRKKSGDVSHKFNNEIMLLNSRTCRYILNEDTSQPKYCFQPVFKSSYCEHHHKLCYYPPEPKRRRTS